MLYLMDDSVLPAIQIIFLLGFTLHNLEEVVWLPRWSTSAGRFYQPVQTDPFFFAVIVITLSGYALTALDFLAGDSIDLLRYAYLGFVGMMGLNAIFPHLVLTVALKKYCPGLMTGLWLNLPLSLLVVIGHIRSGSNAVYVFWAVAIVSGITLVSLKYLFRLGGALLDF